MFPTINVSAFLFTLSYFFHTVYLFFVLVLAAKFTAISEIACGRTAFNLKARVINLWNVPDKLNPADVGGIHMILMDEKVYLSLALFRPHLGAWTNLNFIMFYYMYYTLYLINVLMQCAKIHATIKKNLVPLFKDDITEGSIYVFENFMVGSNDSTYKTTDHKYKLNFMGGTKVWKVTLADIPTNHFKFVSFVDILAAPREDKMLGKASVITDFAVTIFWCYSHRVCSCLLHSYLINCKFVVCCYF